MKKLIVSLFCLLVSSQLFAQTLSPGQNLVDQSPSHYIQLVSGCIRRSVQGGDIGFPYFQYEGDVVLRLFSGFFYFYGFPNFDVTIGGQFTTVNGPTNENITLPGMGLADAKIIVWTFWPDFGAHRRDWETINLAVVPVFQVLIPDPDRHSGNWTNFGYTFIPELQVPASATPRTIVSTTKTIDGASSAYSFGTPIVINTEQDSTYIFGATDSIGYTAQKPFVARLDMTKPTLAVTSTSGGNAINASNSSSSFPPSTSNPTILSISANDPLSNGVASGFMQNGAGVRYDEYLNGQLQFAGPSLSTQTISHYDVAGQVVVSASGKYQFNFYVDDLAGNSALPVTVYQDVLLDPPTVTLSRRNNNDWYARGALPILVRAVDALGNDLCQNTARPVQYSFDGNTWYPLPSNGDLSDVPGFPKDKKDLQVYIKAIDEAGQTNDGWDTTPFKIDIETTDPTLSISYGYGTGEDPLPLQSGVTNYLPVGPLGAPPSLTAARSSMSGFSTDASYSVDASGQSPMSSFAFVGGSHSYTFSVTDNAGNIGTATYQISYSPVTTALSLSTDNASTYLYAAGQSAHLGSTPVAADSLYFKIPKSDFLSSPNYYAPPSSSNSLAVYFDVPGNSAGSYSLTDDSAGNYSNASMPINVRGLSDDQHTLFYTFTDHSGLTSEGRIDLKLHRTAPSPVTASMVARASTRTSASGNAIWSSNGGGGWLISQADVNAAAGASGSDGIQFNNYADTAEISNADFPLSGYQIQVLDALRSVSPISTSTDGTYYFTWGPETSRTLTISALSEAGVASTPVTVTLLKPVWGGLSSPAKVLGANSFAVQWNDDGAAVPHGTRGVNWGLASNALANYASESQGTVSLFGLSVGSTIYYQELITLSEASTSSTGIIPQVEILGDNSSGATTGSFFINYENIPGATLPSALAYIGRSGTLTLPSLSLQAADGQNIQYAVAIGLDSNGTITNPLFVAADQSAGAVRFTYDMLSVFGQADVTALKAFLQGKRIDLRVDAWYGEPLVGGGAPVPYEKAPAVSRGVVQSVQGDFDSPTAVLTGMMGSANPITSSKTISGTGADIGGSHLSKVEVSWAPVVGGSVPSTAVYTPVTPFYFLDSSGQATLDSGSFSVDLTDANGNLLPDGWYAIQVVASDGAGNTWNNGGVAIVKVIDATAPTLASGSLQPTANGVDPSSGAFFTNPDGSISLSLQTNDNNGVGLGSIQYEWSDASDQPLAGQAWVSSSIYPTAAFNQQPVSTEAHVATVLGAPSGIGKLHIRLVDQAGNVGADTTNSAWRVSYNPNPPLVSGITVTGLVQSGGSNYVRSASDLQVGYSPISVVGNQDVQWGVVSGTDPTVWGGWGNGFGSVSSLISVDGQSYQIQFMARNANGQATGVLSSEVFIKDSIAPTNVRASLLAGRSTYIAGEPIQVAVDATASFSGLVWSWSYQNADVTNASAVSAFYQPGASVVIPQQGNYNLVFTVTSGSGIVVGSPSIRVTITGTGLVVRDFQKYSDGHGVIGGAWSYEGGTPSPSSYQYQWITAQGRILQGWQAGNSTHSSTINLTSVTGSSPLGAGDVVQLEVKALDDQNQVLPNGDVTSFGSLVDATAPMYRATSGVLAPSGWLAPAYVTPSDVWVQFQGQDLESGIQGAGLLVKKLVAASDGSYSWKPVTSQNLTTDGSAKRVDLDLSGNGMLVTGDQVVIEVTLINGAGLSTMKASSIIAVDGSAPPVPAVMDMADAVNPAAQGISFSWTFTQPDPESGTVQYFWKAYTDINDLQNSTWTAVDPGQTSVDGLDFSTSGYANSQAFAHSAYPDGTVLHFAVMAMNGAGLSSVGYGHGIIIDRSAPIVQTVAVSDASSTPIAQYVLLANLMGGDGKNKVNVRVDVASLSGVAGIFIQAGQWIAGTGFVPDPSSAVSFTPTPAQVLTQTNYSLPVVLNQPQPGAIYMLAGQVVNAAGNVAQVLYSAGFKIEGPIPVLTGIQGNLSPEQVSFTWQASESSDFIRGYQVSLTKLTAGQPARVVQIPDASGSLVNTIFTTQKSWSGDLEALGFTRGDQVQISVTLLTPLGQSNTLSQTLSFVPDVPIIPPGGFAYTNYFSDHLNIKTLKYKVGAPNIGVEQIQWRALDTQSGQVLQDWTPDYSANNSPEVSYTTEEAPFSTFAHAPANGGRIFIEVKAQSLIGVWSSVTPSASILIDTVKATGTLTRPSEANASIQNPYSNGQGGEIGGWSVSALDAESGLLAYEVVLVRAAVVDAPGFDVRSIWSGVVPLPSAALPGQNLLLQSLLIPGVDVSSTGPTDYYAYLRVQNGTEDWSQPVQSLRVTVDRALPVIRFVYPTGASGVFIVDHQGNPMTVKVTNNALQPLSLTSSKTSTAFVVSVNGAAWSSQPTTVNGTLNGDSSVQSYGSFNLNGPGTQAVSVTATDVFGNQVTITDQMRFNQAPTAALVRSTTTSAQVLNLEQLVDVLDADSDYPMTYQWSLGGGIGVNYTDGATYLGGPTSTWDPAAYHTAKFMLSGKSQSTIYPVILTVSDAWGQVMVFSMNIVVATTSAGTLYTNEYWTGAVNLLGIVEVPAGLTLTLDGAAVTVNGDLSDATTSGSLAIMQGGIVVDAGGSLIVANTSATTRFASGADGYYWRGIETSGTIQGSGLEVDQAERGFVLLPGGSLVFSNLNLVENLIGIHLLGGSVRLNGGTVSGNSEYGIKEDAVGSFIVRNMVFLNNGIGYYQLGKTGITMAELNAIAGNGGNR